ncbi:MAG: heavy-metal-associated domain-containing protein [Spirosomaceae bacterium]|nr:heavy-metal-associated domain-containing protein [Spirosomataceae bacterium]MDP5138996.1 heavy-metal-associated domain-containing protein [Spirosomataceae bacterium]
MNEKFVVANIKCGGCANTIKKELEKLVPELAVAVDFEEGVVEVSSANSFSREVVLNKLSALGYPEADGNNMLLKAKSFASCMVGRLN